MAGAAANSDISTLGLRHKQSCVRIHLVDVTGSRTAVTTHCDHDTAENELAESDIFEISCRLEN